MSQRSRCTSSPALVASLLLAAGLSSGCNDDPSCIFTTGCQDGAGPGALGPEASLPSDFHTILSAPPVLQRTEPSGPGQSSTTPVVLVFSESMAPSTIAGKVELVAIDVSGFPIGPVPTTPVLTGEGRVLVLLPSAPATLAPGDYLVQVVAGAEIYDLTGQKVDVAGGAQLTSFQVNVDDPEEPSVVTTVPGPDEVANTTTPIVVVFDQRIEDTSITGASFDVQVGGVPPAFDPDPVPLTVEASFLPIIDTRVYLYRSVSAGLPVSLGPGQDVVLTMSPGGAEILDEDGNELEEVVVEFSTQDVEAPTVAQIASEPQDGIGILNLTLGDDELEVLVDLVDAEPGDDLVVTMFGDSFEEEPALFALARTIELKGTAPITSVLVTLADLDLAPEPGTARFADGSMAFAFALRRGTQTSPVRLLDVNADAPGIQDPLLDTVAPTIAELLGSGGATDLARSEVRDLVISGRASEPLRRVEVTTLLGDNLMQPAVVGSSADGVFIASPIPIGPSGLIEDGAAVPFDLVAYDPVLNASAPLSGSFEQKGGVGGTAVPFVAGDPILVEVVDAHTLAPIVGARVYTHDDVGDGTTFPVRDADVTGPVGTISVESSPPPAVGTILTVDAAGYDLFTFHGIAAGRISVPLTPTAAALADVGGSLTTTSALAELTLGLLNSKLDDSRRPEGSVATFDGGDCTSLGSLPPTCPFGPEAVRPHRLGALSFLAGNFLLTQGTFSASSLLQAFELSIPRPPTAGGDLDPAALVLPFLLSEPGLDPREIPIEADQTVFGSVLVSGLDTANLVGDPETTGDPWVSVEGLVPGVPGATAVGLGLAFDQGGGFWDVRAAYPGAVSDTGFFGSTGAVDPDLFLRVELRDADGNRTGQRPRLSTLPSLPIPFALFGPAVPHVQSPVDGGATGGASFNVEFENAIIDLSGEPGLYVVTLADGVGRRWRLLLPDPADGATTLVHLPDLAGVGTLPGVPLSDGVIACTVQAYAWPGFDAAEFLLSDVEREHDLFAQSAPISFNQP